jgi:signal transduction histidine kinase
MDSLSVVSRGYPAGSRADRRRRRPPTTRARVAEDAQQSSTRGSLARLASIALVALALADVLTQAAPVRLAAFVAAVALSGFAALLAVIAAERAGLDRARRWHVQAIVCVLVMFMLMAGRPQGASGDVILLATVLGVAGTLVAMATAYSDGVASSSTGALCLLLDATIVGFTTALTTVALGGGASAVGTAAILLGSFAAAGYAVAVSTRQAMRQEPRGADALFLGGVLVLCVYAAGEAAWQLGLAGPAMLAAPGVALVAALALTRSAWSGCSHAASEPPSLGLESRLRLVPALAAVGAILVLSWLELLGLGTRTGFFGIIFLFGLIVSRLVVTLVENRQLLQRVERSGVFEEKLRDLGGALVTTLDQKNTLDLVCRTAQMSLGADSVILWMLDASANELEAVEVLSGRRDALLRRRLAMDDPTALAVRVARTGMAEIVPNASSAGLSNQYLNVLLHSQALLAVPVMRGDEVQGVLVCIHSRSPSAYGNRELNRAELLASQVAVALDNAYQHALQRRRVDELSALYQFAQSAHAALSSTEIVRQLLPILSERLGYVYCTIWLRDESIGTLRLAASDGPDGAMRGLRPSALAMRAVNAGEPAHAEAAWPEDLPAREGLVSKLAVPMVLQRRVVGVVELEASDANTYSAIEERLLVALANHAALAIENLHLLDETRKVAALREIDRMKTELLSTVSHELRTPLGSIKGYATTLLTHGNKLKRDEQREFLSIIDSEADRLRELIENLLDMSRLEAGVLRIDKEPTRLSSLTTGLIRKVQLASPHHTLSVDWPTPDPVVVADPKRIYQVLQNLLTNAVKYSPDGGNISLGASVQRRELVVAITDDGLGMPAVELDKIFDRFHRVGGDVSRHVGGTGLGLAICKGLVESHGGRIWAESEGEGLGSTFKFTLPLLHEAGDVTAQTSRSKGAHDHQEANRTRR